MALLNPSVSPDGTRLAFVTGDGRWKLAEVTPGDGRVRQLGSGSQVVWYPSIGPAGARLAFADSRKNSFHIREMSLAPAGEVVTRTITEVETRHGRRADQRAEIDRGSARVFRQRTARTS